MNKKVNFLVFLTLVLTVFLFIVSIFIDNLYKQKILNKQIKFLKQSVKIEYKKRLKESINNTIKFIDISYKRNKNEKELLEDVREYIYTNIYDKTRYIWINKLIKNEGGDNYAVRLVHPNLKSLEGEFLSTKTTDIKGTFPYLTELNGVKKDGEVYFTYYFKELDSQKITKKLSYGKLYKKLNWIISTGIPLNTLDSLITKEKEKLQFEYKKLNNKILLLDFLIVLLFISIVLFFRRKIINLIESNLDVFKRYKEALNVTDDGIWEWNIQTNKVYYNKAWKEMLGFNYNELKNDFSTWEKLVHPDEYEDTKQKVFNYIEGLNDKFEVEFRMKCKNGSYKWILSRAKKVEKDKDGNTIKVIGIHSDIQVRKQMQLDLEKHKKYLEKKVQNELENSRKKDIQLLEQSKMASLGEMIGHIAHQWRQPLSIISTAASGLKLENELKTLDDEKLEYYTFNITNSTQHLSETIDTFRNFLKEKKEKRSLIIQERIDTSLCLVKDSLKNKNITLINNINYEKEIEIELTPGELSQVLINLITNAKDILEERNIESPWIKIDLKDNKQFIEISIEDNAGGIKEDIIEHVFEPYFTTKHEFEGTGLGLYMSYRIVNESIKGKIYIKNTKNGAKFFVEIPK